MDNKENKKKEIKNKIIKITALLGLFLLVFGVSYALFSVVLSGTKKNRITTANFGLKLSSDLEGNDETEGYAIDLINAVPISDEEGLEQEGYTFVVSNTGTIPASYALTLEDVIQNTLNDEYIKYNLETKDYLNYVSNINDNYNGLYNSKPKLLEVQNLSSLKNRVLDTTTILPGEKIQYTLKLWIDYDANIEQAANKTFEGKIKIDGVQATKYGEGKSGENVKYTLYNDGTLIFTGTGSIQAVNVDFSGDDPNVTLYNNISPVIDLLYKKFTEKNLTSVSVEDDPETYMLWAQYVNNSFDYQFQQHALTDENIESCKNSTSDLCNKLKAYANIFNNDLDVLKQAVKSADEIPKISRVVVGEGITNLSNYLLTQSGNYMISLPSTLENIGMYSFLGYSGYTIIIPNLVTTIPISTFSNSFMQYLNIPSNVTTIEEQAFDTASIRVLNISNSVTAVSPAFEGYSSGIINIDNTKEFVDTNWDQNWAYGSLATVNYLK